MKKWLKRGLLFAALAVVGAVLLVWLLMWSGLADRWTRSAVIQRLEEATGGRVELGEFHFRLFPVRAVLKNLTIHGRESADLPPFFHADEIFVDIRIDSFLSRKISLHEARVDRPFVHIRVEADGSSNVPIPKPGKTAAKAWHERIFELVIAKLRINDGQVLINEVRVPLVAEGGRFNFVLDYHSEAGSRFYSGRFSWEQMILVLRRYLPFPSDLSAQFTITPLTVVVDQLHWKLPHSDVDAQLSLVSYVRPEWSFRYRGRFDLRDLREISRKPNAPSGVTEFYGEGSYSAKQWSTRGHYSAHEIAMPYKWFHSGGMTSRGSFHAENGHLEVPDFEAHALGGAVHGRVLLVFHGQQFRAETHGQGMSLAAILAAVDNTSFPMGTLHWNASVHTDAVTTWSADFKHLDSRGISFWEPLMEPRTSEIPATGRIDFHYAMDPAIVELKASEISTPSSRIVFNGTLGRHDSALEATFDSQDLVPWDDFINRLRGQDAEPKRIAGRANWQGRVLGPLEGPTFTGHVKGFQASYGRLYWDEIEGDMTYSPDQFRLVHGLARHGRSSAQLELALELTDWGFAGENHWTLDANLVRAPTDDLQELFGWNYPAHGLLTGQFHGRGTRADPELSGLFDVSEVDAFGYHFDRARGQLTVRRDEVRVSNAELRALPPPPPAPRTAGVITGNFAYRLGTGDMSFDLTGAGLPIESIERLRTTRLPLAGQLSFQWSGKGPLRALESTGAFRIVDLRVGKEVLGSFEGKLNSDGRRVHLDLGSAIYAGKLNGKVDLTLAGDYPIYGDVTVQGIDLDPFLQTALHLTALTGHSSVDGRFVLTGALLRPDSISVQADISHIVFDYENVKLENVGPLRITYRRDEVRIEQAYLRGPDTDFRFSGFARFAGDRRLEMNLAGTINLRLLGGFVPDLEARGPAQVNASIAGTFSSPRIIGKVHLENAGANYGDFPAGLSRVSGDFVFDTSRLLYENVTAETGGGQLLLSGTLTYGEGPLHYDLTARTSRVRIRYPEGMSWLSGGTLRLSGTRQAAVLSGRVEVQRLLMAQGFDLASLIVSAKEPVRAPSTSSPFLRNLQFDIEAASAPDARMEWTGAVVETEASLRVRGTWEHPILIGHIHLLSGEMTFRGNRYKLARGDINFSNPFRLDPVLNVEATTTIRQYEVTLDFSGPASRMTLAYRSDPPLPAGDVIALLALGRTGPESELRSTSVQSTQVGAQALLSEAISSQLGGRVERLFGISRFRVDPFLAGTSTEQNAAARVTIEQQVTKDLVITYITNVTSTQQQVVQVEYNIRKHISIIALRDQNGTFGLDIKFKKRFK